MEYFRLKIMQVCGYLNTKYLEGRIFSRASDLHAILTTVISKTSTFLRRRLKVIGQSDVWGPNRVS